MEECVCDLHFISSLRQWSMRHLLAGIHILSIKCGCQWIVWCLFVMCGFTPKYKAKSMSSVGRWSFGRCRLQWMYLHCVRLVYNQKECDCNKSSLMDVTDTVVTIRCRLSKMTETMQRRNYFYNRVYMKLFVSTNGTDLRRTRVLSLMHHILGLRVRRALFDITIVLILQKWGCQVH